MAVQALGLPLLLQANDQQLQDLLSGLKVGDSLKGRIVELLSPDKAVVGLRGQNVIAQLPHSDFQKGEILSLQVFQNKPAEAGQAPSLTLKLLPPQVPSNPSAWAVSMPNLDQAPLPSAATLEAALATAQLPQNSLTLSVAQTLASLGVPLEAPALARAVQSAQSLLNAETALFSPPPAQSQQAQVEFQAAVRAALDQLQVASQTLPQGEGRLALDQASRLLQGALPASPSLLQAASIVASPIFDAQGGILPAPAPQAPAVVVPSQWNAALETFIRQPSLQGFETLKLALADLAPKAPLQIVELSLGKVQAPMITTAPGTGLPQAANVASAVPMPAAAPVVPPTPGPVTAQTNPGVASAPAPSTLAPAPSTLASAPSTLASAPSTPNATGPVPSPAAVGPAPAQTPAVPLGLELDPVPAKVLVQRETLALLSPGLQADSYSPAAFAKALQALSQALEQPQSPAVQALLDSVSSQAPTLTPTMVLQEARALVQGLSQRWSPAIQAAPEAPAVPGAANNAPLAASVAPATALAAAPPALAAVPQDHQAARTLLQDLGLPVPRQTLSAFTPATVGESVAWLQARDLPAQRPLVEAVAMWLATGEAVLPKTEAALLGAQELPERVFNANPGLRQAVDHAVSAYHASALRPDDPQFTQKLIDWVHSTGLNLEFQASKLPNSGFAQPATEGLRPALLHMERALRTAQTQMQAQQDLPAVKAIEQIIAPTQQAIQALQALPLQAQAVPGFDTIQLPLPVWMAGQVGDGRLSVSWRQGRDRELHEKDPVNVAVSLKTEGLGEVKVLLQVWKGAAQARVLAETQATADFMSQGAEDLKGAFSQRTPFALQSLDFAVAEKAPQNAHDAAAPASGLSLSA